MKNIGNGKYLYGIYRGVVEYNYDPLRIGRCKVRVPSLHGKMTDQMVSMLPWARPKQAHPSGMDSGSFIVPEVGMTVWVQFEGGDRNYPIFEGGSHGIVDGINEIPGESYDAMEDVLSPRGNPVKSPSSWTLYKSGKGFTIGGTESDTKEESWMIDRAGQMLKSTTHMKKGTPPRKSRTASSPDRYDYEDTESGKILSIFKSFSGGFIKFVSEKFKERVDLLSRSLGYERVSGISLRSGQDNTETIIVSHDEENRVHIKLDATRRRVEIGLNGAGFIVIEGDQVLIPKLTVDELIVNTIYEREETIPQSIYPGDVELDTSDE